MEAIAADCGVMFMQTHNEATLKWMHWFFTIKDFCKSKLFFKLWENKVYSSDSYNVIFIGQKQWITFAEDYMPVLFE